MSGIHRYNSVAVHIRRGDFKQQSFRVLPITYYARAMQNFSQQKDVKFYIFTDDPAFVKGCFANLANVKVVSDPTGSTFLEELYLMSECKHIIIANSSFSWWSAYLCKNPEATIIAPFPKYEMGYLETYPKGNSRELARWVHTEVAFPKHWKTLNPFVLQELLP